MKIWAWLVKEPDGKEGIIRFLHKPDWNDVLPLVTISEHMVPTLQMYAELHGKRTGKPIRMAVFEEVSEGVSGKSAPPQPKYPLPRDRVH